MDKMEAKLRGMQGIYMCDDGTSAQNGSIDHMVYVGHIVTKNGMV